MVACIVIEALVAITLGLVLFQVLKQQGRILHRLDELELKAAGASAPAELEIGTLVQDFQAPDLSGRNVSLSDFRDRRVLLIYWNPQCGFCDMLAAELAPLQTALKKNNTEVVLVTYGDVESNRKLAVEHGLDSTILLIESSPAKEFIVNELFRHRGTPSAYLLDEQKRVIQALAVGMDDILRVAREACDRHPALGAVSKGGHRPPLQRESRIVRDGLKAGTPAPAFRLPDIHGGTVSLDQFRGRKLLLVFSDPQCGPCDQLAPELARLHRKHAGNGLDFVMVGRGDPEQNKKKAVQHRIEFPVLLQEKWKLSRQYGIFATPVAFLVGKDGVIARNVATGPDEIMTLAYEGLASN